MGVGIIRHNTASPIARLTLAAQSLRAALGEMARTWGRDHQLRQNVTIWVSINDESGIKSNSYR
jgi:hypothetical protein